MNTDAQDPAIQAFEALREEVAQLRGQIALMGAPTDYSLTLRDIVQSLERLEHAAIQQAQAGGAGRAEVDRGMAMALAGLNRQTSALQDLVGRERRRRDGWTWIALASLSGVIIGVALCVALLGPVARAMPENWGVADRMARAALGQEAWDRGIKFMAHADDATWNQLATGLKLVQPNAVALDKCSKAASRGKSKACVIQMPAPVENGK